MIEEILTATGMPHRQSHFPVRFPDETCAVWLDDITADGPDGYNRIFTHNVTVELYAAKIDPEAEATLEAEFNARGLHWEKQSAYWLRDVQRYQTIYEITYTIKN